MKYFSIAEMCNSHTARRYGIDNRCNAKQESRLKELVVAVLDPLREKWGKPITVNSGFRSVELNQRVKGNPASQHLRGEAADITAGNKSDNRKLFELIQEMDLPFDQLIDEQGMSWIHVSHRKGNNRRLILRL